MKYMKFVLLVLCALVISLNVNAKEEKYGNVTLRSIGVGNIHKKPIQQQFVTPNNSNNNYYVSYGRPTDMSNTTVVTHQQPTTVKAYSFTAYDNTPFAETTVATTRAMYSFGGGDDPNHPGVPVGNALPFMIFLAGIYFFIRNRK